MTWFAIKNLPKTRMTDSRPRIVFMGTPEFAVATLDAIVKSGNNVVAVVTAPDKPSGRGQKVSFSPVKEYAQKNHIEVLQPEKLRDDSFIERLKSLKADIFVVVAFRMLPEQVWSIPHLGTFNAHASLLPQYRGAAPINHAIINGETVSGVTTFLIDKEIDTGKILLAEETPIDLMDNAGDLHDRLMTIAANLTVKTIEGLVNKTVTPRPQKHITADTILKPAPKIFPADTYVDWNKSMSEVHNFIRGLSPYPGARTVLKNGEEKLSLKILGSKPAALKLNPAEIFVTAEGELLIGCDQGSVEITWLQAEGRKRMPAADFLRGFDIKGWQLARD
jgi:methionyl-tRNA formyltransferase